MTGNSIIRVTEVSSTNDLAKEYARKKVENGTIILADKQSRGRGRLGNAWASPSGENIYMSVIYYTNADPPALLRLPLVVSYATATAVEEMTGLETGIKWPNDLIVGKKKLCGILLESLSIEDGTTAVIIGIGLNVNSIYFPPSLCEKATSLRIETGQVWDRERLLQAIASQLDSCFFQQAEFILAAYEKKCVTITPAVEFGSSAPQEKWNIVIEKIDPSSGQERRRACAYGLDEYGRLLVQYENGEKEAIASGDVHVRGIYGYV